ncbi:hypothetical protein [Prosthecobacter sp.]|uniref:hypothetical protein n=1 Tax=Prosthecobacter sp. TaxID=1965333 RepID=UPI00378323ED
MKTLSSEPHPPSATVVKKRTAWYGTGVALIVAGIAIIPTIALAAIGGGLILVGIATITAAYIQGHPRDP